MVRLQYSLPLIAAALELSAAAPAHHLKSHASPSVSQVILKATKVAGSVHPPQATLVKRDDDGYDNIPGDIDGDGIACEFGSDCYRRNTDPDGDGKDFCQPYTECHDEN